MAPALALEHLEQGDLFGVERIALDRLQMHGFEPPLSGGCNLFGAELFILHGHILIIPCFSLRCDLSEQTHLPVRRIGNAIICPRHGDGGCSGE